MSIELDKMKLVEHIRDKDTGATKTLKSIYNISINDKRRVVELKILGMQGGVLQDFGRNPVVISFEGIIFGENSKVELETLRSKYKQGKALDFLSNISGIAEITQALIEEFIVDDISTGLNRYHYLMRLKEYVPPPEEEESPDQDEEAKDEAEDKADDAKDSINMVVGKVVNAEGNPLKDVDVKVTYDGGELTLKTDEKGVYKKDDLEPGIYTVTVDAPGYKGVKREVEIKSKDKENNQS
ncbi:carboxypeptidase regulatory-like domain-containing protein [Candidatus Bathyarchaeota archaeon]|nr:carboxypeptidase regulatory-like domain-containing protein [Candidatus Bathyarchaeota archaeon]